MANHDATGRQGAESPAPDSEEQPRVQEDLSALGPVDERMLDIGRSLEKGEIASPANQESSTGIVSRG
jgi:hypothetical protein